MSKIMWSWLGAFVGIFAIVQIGRFFTQSFHDDSIFLIGSFGASAVLAYGAPTAEFSQPRNLVLGHVVSAFAGVAAFKLAPAPEQIAVASALAVSGSLFAMHFTRSLHPPGGATALIAVIGGEGIHALGFRYVLTPVLPGAVILLLVALAVNNLSRNPLRHYPSYWY